MGASTEEGGKGKGFFAKVLGGLGGGGGSKETRTRIEGQLAKAGPDTLNDCQRIIAIVVLHEKPWPGQYAVKRVLARWIDEHKGPGWVPFRLMVKDETILRTVQRPDAAGLSVSKSNAILAEWLTTMTKGQDLSGTESIAFSADNDALGRTIYAVLAK